jgi:hypothetical protein
MHFTCRATWDWEKISSMIIKCVTERKIFRRCVVEEKNSYVCNVSNTHFQLSYTCFRGNETKLNFVTFFLITQEGMEDTDQI